MSTINSPATPVTLPDALPPPVTGEQLGNLAETAIINFCGAQMQKLRLSLAEALGINHTQIGIGSMEITIVKNTTEGADGNAPVQIQIQEIPAAPPMTPEEKAILQATVDAAVQRQNDMILGRNLQTKEPM